MVATYPNPSPSLSGFTKLIMFALLVLAAVIAVSALNAHATARHPGEAEQVNQCLRDNGPLQLWGTADRYRIICQIAPNLWGIKVVDRDGNTITAMIKDKMHRLEQVINYLKNGGNELIWKAGESLDKIPAGLR